MTSSHVTSWRHYNGLIQKFDSVTLHLSNLQNQAKICLYNTKSHVIDLNLCISLSYFITNTDQFYTDW